MDLGKIRGKLSGMEYRTTKEFVADIYLIFQNCSVYNRPGSLEHSSGVSLLGTFERLLSHHGLGRFPHAPCFEDEETGSKRTSKRVSKRPCCDSDSEDHGSAKRGPASPLKDAATSSSNRSSGKRRTH